jgi:ATP-dependent Clp protease ATP-binding subunit ClpC
MNDHWSVEAGHVWKQAEDLAAAADADPTTLHLLLAMFVTACGAAELLADAGIEEGRVLDAWQQLRRAADGVPPSESATSLDEVARQADLLAESVRAPGVSSAVLLAALLRGRRGLAVQALTAAGVRVGGLRAHVIGRLTQRGDRSSSRVRRASSTTVRPREASAGRGETDRRSRLAPSRVPPLAPELEQRLQRRRPSRVAAPAPRPTRAEPKRAAPSPESRRSAPARPQPEAVDGQAPAADAHEHSDGLDETRYPTLAALGRDLTAAARRGELQAVVGRDAIIAAVIDVLMMRQVNNPCLVGEAGVGKTAIVEGLAQQIVERPERFGRLGQARIIEVPVSSLLAGTSYRGAFAERMRALRDEVDAADGAVVVFIDEIHTLMGAGAGDGALDAANDLKAALSRGRFPLIGATTPAEYRRHVERDPAMERRLQVIEVPEPDEDEAVTILRGIAPVYEQHHGLPYDGEAMVAAVRLSQRYIVDRCLPDKAIAVLDRAGAVALRAGHARVRRRDVAAAVSQLTRVPIDRLLIEDQSRVRGLGGALQATVLGQAAAMERVAARIRRNYAGFSDERPLASFVFAGPAGVGKTEAASVLAAELFGLADSLARFDMGEYAETHALNKLLGSPPGYVGHEEAGTLSTATRSRAGRVLLFDEVDRAADEVLGVLAQLVDTGRVRDNQGRTLDARNAVLVFTLRATDGADTTARPARSIGFGAAPEGADGERDRAALVLEDARSRLPPELLRRVDDVVVFEPLGDEALAAITQRAIEASIARLERARGIALRPDAAVAPWVVARGRERGEDGAAAGARPVRGWVEALIEGWLADRVLDGELARGAAMRIEVGAEGLILAAPGS